MMLTESIACNVPELLLLLQDVIARSLQESPADRWSCRSVSGANLRDSTPRPSNHPSYDTLNLALTSPSFPYFVASSIFWVCSLVSLWFIFSVSVAFLHSWGNLSKRKRPPFVDGQSDCSTINSLFCGLFEVIRLLTSLIPPIPQFQIAKEVFNCRSANPLSSRLIWATFRRQEAYADDWIQDKSPWHQHQQRQHCQSSWTVSLASKHDLSWWIPFPRRILINPSRRSQYQQRWE